MKPVQESIFYQSPSRRAPQRATMVAKTLHASSRAAISGVVLSWWHVGHTSDFEWTTHVVKHVGWTNLWVPLQWHGDILYQ
jgi:hypothetical protein